MSLFGPLFGTTAAGAATSDAAWVAALCEVEAALTRACAAAGLVPESAATAVADVCGELASYDPAALGEAAVAGGNPVIPLVPLLRERVAVRAGDEAARAVHYGATSQDIFDTAAMLVAHRVLGGVVENLAACGDAAAALASRYRDTPMVARTLMQQALPTTFGALAATWGGALDGAWARVSAAREALPVSLGGPGGTLAGWHPHGFEVLRALADELGLAVPTGVWHTDRTVLVDLAAACGAAGGAVSKTAGDVVLLSQSEIGEVREANPGGSSSMGHKKNPIAAITARAAAASIPGFVATLLANADPQLQRGAGPWHAEWPALIGLLRATGGGVARLRASLEGLTVDVEAMRGHLSGLLDSLGGAAETGHAVDLVDRYLKGRA